MSKDLSWVEWAKSPEFKAKMDKAFADIEAGRYESFSTIDELIEYIDIQTQEFDRTD